MKMYLNTVKLVITVNLLFTIDFCVFDFGNPGIRFLSPSGATYRTHEIIYVLEGQPLELYCTGPKEIEVRKMTERGEEIISNKINETTIRIYDRKPDKKGSYYHCYDGEDYFDSTTVSVIVVTNFRCRSKQLDHLNCTWEATYYDRSFTLYSVGEEKVTLICKLTDFTFTFCTLKLNWLSNLRKPENLILETCNTATCTNQTFSINLYVIIKLYPPSIKLIKKTAHSAILEWRLSSKRYDEIHMHCKFMTNCYVQHRISYWYSGIQSKTNASFLLILEDTVNEIELKLPCADQFYEVKIAVKLSTSVGDEFWSEDAVTSFQTDADSTTDAITDSSCTRERVKIIPEIMLFKMDQFRSKTTESLNEMIETIRLMKVKVKTPAMIFVT